MKYRIIQIKGDSNFYIQKQYLFFFWKFILNEIGIGYFIKLSFISIEGCKNYINNLHNPKPKLLYSIIKIINIK